MSVRWRPMQSKDVRECVEIVATHPEVGPRYGGATDDLQKAWLSILGRDAVIALVLEELDGRRTRAWGVGVSVVVTEEFLNEIKRPPLFWLGPVLAKRVVGGESPLLSDKQLREANSTGGLNAVCWEGCIRAEDERRPEYVRCMMGAFLDTHRGYLWNEVLAYQARSAERLKWTFDSGGQLWNPAEGRYWESPREDLQEIVRQPHIIGVTGEMARHRLGAWVDAVFDYRTPRIGFSRAEQQLLEAALHDEAGTDRELAVARRVSVSTIKKIWVSIYDRAASCMPDLIPNNSRTDHDAVQRGTEKRRHLLAYLRDHPEELRPFSRKLLQQNAMRPM